jgi:hypothetical protein
MLAHGFAVDRRHDDRGANCASRAQRAEQVCGVAAIVPYRPWTRADRRPNIFQCSLLPDPGFILEPDLDRPPGGGGAAEQGVLYQAGKFFLKATSASGSFFG